MIARIICWFLGGHQWRTRACVMYGRGLLTTSWCARCQADPGPECGDIVGIES